MSIYKKQTVVASFPAYDIVVRDAANVAGEINITADDKLGLDSGKGFYRVYTPGSVASYALQYNECPHAAYERAVAHKHSTHWINQDSTCISSSPQDKKTLVKVEVGTKVIFEGKHFTIAADHNNNLKFVG